jgi:hypothetical protein
MSWNRALNLYVDVNKPGGAFPLLEAKTSSPAGDISMIFGDVFPLHIYFRAPGVVGASSTAEQLPSGSGLVVAAKKKDTPAGDVLFLAGSFIETDSGDDLHYVGDLDLNTLPLETAIGSASSIQVDVDIEVQFDGNTQRQTFRFGATIYRQMYDGESAPAVPAANWPRLEGYTDPVTGALCVRVLNGNGETVAEFSPTGG